MASTWFPPGLALDVPNPGYGELRLEASAHPFRGEPLVDQDWQSTLTGPQLGEFLTQVTERAFHPEPASGPPGPALPDFVTPAVARAMLPALQQAVLEAVAGGDRFARVFLDNGRPVQPYCVNCGAGSRSTIPGQLPCQWCDQHGHTPFGEGAEVSWSTAQRLHAARMKRWEAAEAARSAVTPMGV